MTGRPVPCARQRRGLSARTMARGWPTAAFAFVAFVHVGPGVARSADMMLPEVTVQEQRLEEKANGPVQGYRATRSATFTKTDTPLMEVPASITVVPGDLIQDQAAASLAEALR